MTSKTLLQVFESRLSHLKYNKALQLKFYNYYTAFIHKDEESMLMWSGNLTGLYICRFTPKDTNTFFNEILETDVDDLADDIVECKDINQDFVVVSDTFNLTCMYLIHKFLTTPYLQEEARERAALDIALIYNCRLLTSLLSHYFKYPASESQAKATYANLSFKFLIKRLGSWNEVMLFRSKDMIGKESIHRKTFMKFNVDLDITYAISDSQGRIRDLLKNIYAEFMRVHDRGERISTSSSTVIDTDGVEVIKDKSHGLENYTTYILNVMPDRNSFIKKELVDIVLDLMHTTQKNAFIKTLEWFSDNLTNKKYPEVEEFVKLTIVHSYEFLNSHSTTLHNTKDLPGFLSRIRGVYLSSRSTDEMLMKLRDIGEVLIGEASGSRSENAISSIRTSLLLYLNLRTYTKNHYTH